MFELSASAILFLLLIVASALGFFLQGKLREHHRQRETTDAIRLVISILLTFTALALGLLTSSSKNAFDQFGARMRGYSIDLLQVDQALREYGPEAASARTLLRTYVAAAIADTWQNEPAPAGDYPRKINSARPGSVEGVQTGALFEKVSAAARNLDPTDRPHRLLADSLNARLASATEMRWRLIQTAEGTVSWPLMTMMTFWLVMIFAVFGLSSPRNLVVNTTIALCAFSIASAIYLILELNSPLEGWLVVSSQPLRDVLAHIDAPG